MAIWNFSRDCLFYIDPRNEREEYDLLAMMKVAPHVESYYKLPELDGDPKQVEHARFLRAVYLQKSIPRAFLENIAWYYETGDRSDLMDEDLSSPCARLFTETSARWITKTFITVSNTFADTRKRVWECEQQQFANNPWLLPRRFRKRCH